MCGRVCQSLLLGGAIVSLLWLVCPERWENVLFWSLPVFHRAFPPWTAGPNPYAALCSLALDAVIVASVAFVVLTFHSERVRTRPR